MNRVCNVWKPAPYEKQRPWKERLRRKSLVRCELLVCRYWEKVDCCLDRKMREKKRQKLEKSNENDYREKRKRCLTACVFVPSSVALGQTGWWAHESEAVGLKNGFKKKKERKMAPWLSLTRPALCDEWEGEQQRPQREEEKDRVNPNDKTEEIKNHLCDWAGRWQEERKGDEGKWKERWTKTLARDLSNKRRDIEKWRGITTESWWCLWTDRISSTWLRKIRINGKGKYEKESRRNEQKRRNGRTAAVGFFIHLFKT